MVLTPPKRLFDISLMKTVMYDDVADDVKKKEYIAVSHVWGNQKKYKPEELGIKGGINWEIPLSNTSKLRRLVDALNRTGMEYCWLDVLCMNQDKQDEINKEIPFMGDYYSGAKGTLVLSDEEYDISSEDLEKWIHIAQDISKTKRSLTTEEAGWLFDHGKNLLDVTKDQWFKRIWTLQEAVLSEVLIVVDTKGFHIPLSKITFLLSRTARIDPRFALPFNDPDILIQIGGCAVDYAKYPQTLAIVLEGSISRDCYREQDRFYGMLGLLGYKNFPVDYNINMEDLNKKMAQYAYSKGDLSWMSVAGNITKSFIQPMYKPFRSIGGRWEDKSNIAFENDALYMNVVKYARIVDRKYLVGDSTNSDQNHIQGLLALRDWGFSVDATISFLTETENVPNGIAWNIARTYVFGIFRNSGNAITWQGIKLLFGSDAAQEHIGFVITSIADPFPAKGTVVKTVLNETGKEMVFLVEGSVDIGDQIVLVKIHREDDNLLGIVVDDSGRRKGVCKIRKPEISDDLYERCKFPL
jgi:hypothetical protein